MMQVYADVNLTFNISSELCTSIPLLHTPCTHHAYALQFLFAETDEGKHSLSSILLIKLVFVGAVDRIGATASPPTYMYITYF